MAKAPYIPVPLLRLHKWCFLLIQSAFLFLDWLVVPGVIFSEIEEAGRTHRQFKLHMFFTLEFGRLCSLAFPHKVNTADRLLCLIKRSLWWCRRTGACLHCGLCDSLFALMRFVLCLLYLTLKTFGWITYAFVRLHASLKSCLLKGWWSPTWTRYQMLVVKAKSSGKMPIGFRCYFSVVFPVMFVYYIYFFIFPPVLAPPPSPILGRNLTFNLLFSVCLLNCI